jgi:hypothetical protein
MRDSGVEQAACQLPRRYAIGYRRAGEPARDLSCPGWRQAQDPDRRSADEHRAVRDQPRSGIGAQPKTGGHGLVDGRSLLAGARFMTLAGIDCAVGVAGAYPIAQTIP